MAQYKLTEQEARALATEIANGLNSISPQTDYEKWFPKYMKTYNKVMNAIDKYNQSSGA